MEQEKIVFEGQVTYSKKVLMEFIRVPVTKVFWLYLVLGLFFVVAGVSVGVEENFFDVVPLFCILLGILLPAALVANCRFQMKLLYAQCLEKGKNQELYNLVQFSNDEIIFKNLQTGNTDTYLYSVIKKVTESKNLVLCMTKAKVTVIVEKATLKYGSKDELIAFVKSKISAK